MPKNLISLVGRWRNTEHLAQDLATRCAETTTGYGGQTLGIRKGPPAPSWLRRSGSRADELREFSTFVVYPCGRCQVGVLPRARAFGHRQDTAH